MQKEKQASAARDRTERNMRKTAALLSEMLVHTVAETRRLQRQQEKALGRRYEDKAELNQDYKPGEMKDLTALLKDITAVTKALDERGGEEKENAAMGVVLLPQVEKPAEGKVWTDGSDAH